MLVALGGRGRIRKPYRGVRDAAFPLDHFERGPYQMGRHAAKADAVTCAPREIARGVMADA